MAKENRICIGVIAEQKGDLNARIKIFAWKDGGIWRVEDDEIKNAFKPFGYVFAPGLFSKDPKFKLNAIIQFSSIPNQEENEENWKDQWIYNAPKSPPEKIISVGPSIWRDESQDSISLSALENLDISDRYFFASHGIWIIGEFQKKADGAISPKTGMDVNLWKITECVTVKIEEELYLLERPKSNFRLADCMKPRQLADWFRDRIKDLNSDLCERLDREASWRDELARLAEASDDQLYSARFKRTLKMFEEIDLEKESLKELSKIVPSLRDIFITKIEQFKQEIKSEMDREYMEAKKEHTRLLEERRSLKDMISKLQEQYSTESNDLEYIKKNYNRLLQDFRTKLAIDRNRNPDSSGGCTYEIDEILPNTDAIQINQSSIFRRRLKASFQTLFVHQSRLERELIELMQYHHAILVPDIRIPISIAQATNNCYYLLRPTEADWIKFQMFWEGGLDQIWSSSHEHPDRFHFLMLQGINLASPECYLGPLNDILLGIRSRLPYSNTPWPENLWVFASKVSAQEPEPIGLPMIENSFKGWGGISEKEANTEPYLSSEVAYPSENIFLSPATFNGWKDSEELQRPDHSTSHYFDIHATK